MELKAMGIGVLGGSFDPIHLGHLAIAADVMAAFSLEKVLFVPAHRSPLREAPKVTPNERLHMCELATADNPCFGVSGIELQKPPPSYTMDTITEIQQNYPNQALTIIVGADLTQELEDWRAIKELLSKVRMIVVERPGTIEHDLKTLALKLGVESNRLQRHRTAGLEISSTDIRARIASNRPYRYYLHPAVWSHINKFGLYSDTHD